MYIILIYMKIDNVSNKNYDGLIAAIHNEDDEICIFKNYSDALKITKENDLCKRYSCEILNIEKLQWNE